MKTRTFSRRAFIHHGLTLAAGAPLAYTAARSGLLAAETADRQPNLPSRRPGANVAIVSCRTYGPEVRPALEKCFDLLGGIGSLVRNKTVAVKLNLTGNDYRPSSGGLWARPM